MICHGKTTLKNEYTRDLGEMETTSGIFGGLKGKRKNGGIRGWRSVASMRGFLVGMKRTGRRAHSMV
jgi:hypothetical protein